MAPIPKTCVDRIKSNAWRDKIDLSVLPFLEDAFSDISTLATNRKTSELPTFSNSTRFDTHTHPVPSWFRTLQPQSAGRETPSWDPLSHLQFMDQHNISRSITCVSTPQANAFPDDKAKTVALARLLNEFTAELARVYPDRFSWMAVTPLPYVEDAVAEVRYALEELGAVGVGVLTNHEGLYPGEKRFDPVWQYLQERAEKGDGREIVFIHPHDPVIRLEDGRLVSSKPCAFISPDLDRWLCAHSSSSPPLRSGRVLLRDCTSDIQHHSEPNYHQVSKHPLASISWCGCLSGHLRPISTWLPEGRGRSA